MKYGGVSLTGSYHAQNQDSYVARAVSGGHVLAVSDGLGSKIHSRAGSAVLCLVVCELAASLRCNISDEEEFIRQLHKGWKETLQKSYLNPNDCCATALIGIISARDLWLLRLGDGFVGAWVDDEITVMFDEKNNNFANETDCLGIETDPQNWEFRHTTCECFHGIVAGTDGLMFDNDETVLKKFTVDFCDNYRNLNLSAVLTDVGEWLPKCKGPDDKTLAFVIGNGLQA